MGRRRQRLQARGAGQWNLVHRRDHARRASCPSVHSNALSQNGCSTAPADRRARGSGGRATFSEVTNTPLEELLAAWLTSAATEVSSAQGDGSLFETYARHFLRFFQTTERVCDEVAIEQYKEHRLGQVQATTVRGELSALRRLHRWMKKRKLLSALPEVPKVRSARQARRTS